MTKGEIFEIILNNTEYFLSDIDKNSVTTQNSLKDLGANSIDRMDIVVKTMEDLKLTIPMVEFSNVKNIDQLIDLFYQKIISY